jgi:pantetheine-phosphate adenylyltransferase
LKPITVLYPGSFDPITLGHLDIIERASNIFERVIVSVAAESEHKHYTFSGQTRVQMIRAATTHLENVTCDSFSGLVTANANAVGARALIRGLRAISDFELEFQMASMNKKLAPDVETIFMMTQTRFSFLSSSIVKEIARLGGDISWLVPEPIVDKVVAKLGSPKPQ